MCLKIINLEDNLNKKEDVQSDTDVRSRLSSHFVQQDFTKLKSKYLLNYNKFIKYNNLFN